MTDSTDPLDPDLKGDAVTIRCFDGAGSVDQVRLSGLFSCPDSNGAAGYRYFVEFINHVFSIYDKETGSFVGSRVTDTQFWGAAGISGGPGNVIDPRIVFIPDAGRNGQWLAVQLDLGQRVLMATTDPNDPYCDPSLGKWRATVFDLPGNDFTMLGYDQRGVYISTNSSNAPPTPPSPPPDKRSPEVVFIPRVYALAYPPQFGPDAKVIGPLHYEQFGDSPYPAIDSGRAAWPYETLIGVDNLSKRHLTFSLFSPQFRDIVSHGKIDVEPFTPIPFNYRVRQPAPIGVGAVPWNNTGLVAAPMSDGFNIWLAQTVINTTYGCLVVRWYRLYIDPLTRIPGVAAWGEIFTPRYDCFNPSILSFGKDDWTIISFSRSVDDHTSRDPSSALCGNIGAYAALVREDGSKPTIYPLKSGQAPDYVPAGSQRWGDYSTVCRDPDPNTPRRAWIVNQYVERGGGSPTTSQWRDVIAVIDLP